MPVHLLHDAYCDAMNCIQTKGDARMVWTDASIQDWLLMLDAGGEL